MGWHRTFLTAAVLTACIARPAEGQLGIKGGLSHANVAPTGVVPEDLGPRTGLALGVSVASRPGLLGAGAELLYAQRGTELPGPANAWNLDYLDVPAYLTVMLPAPGIAPYAYAGPQVSFEVRCQVGNGTCPDMDRPPTTYAGVIGAGVRLGGASAISIEGRYVYGLQDLRLDTVTDENNYRHRSFLILAGISF